MKSLPLFLAALILTALPVRAHFVWLERDAAGATAAYFGEWADDVRETQEGYLKIIAGPRGVAADGSVIAATAGQDRIAVASPKSGDARFTAHYRPEKGDNLVRYHARLGRTETAGVLDLEIVPATAGSNTLRVLFKGAPLPQAEVTLFTSEGWHRKFAADAEGRVTILTPWPGACVLEVAHLDKTPGELDGRAHAAVRHVSTLMFNASADS